MLYTIVVRLLFNHQSQGLYSPPALFAQLPNNTITSFTLSSMLKVVSNQ